MKTVKRILFFLYIAIFFYCGIFEIIDGHYLHGALMVLFIFGILILHFLEKRLESIRDEISEISDEAQTRIDKAEKLIAEWKSENDIEP